MIRFVIGALQKLTHAYMGFMGYDVQLATGSGDTTPPTIMYGFIGR
jgi:hypothetical protein